MRSVSSSTLFRRHGISKLDFEWRSEVRSCECFEFEVDGSNRNNHKLSMNPSSSVNCLECIIISISNHIWQNVVSTFIDFDYEWARQVRRFEMSCRQESILDPMVGLDPLPGDRTKPDLEHEHCT